MEQLAAPAPLAASAEHFRKPAGKRAKLGRQGLGWDPVAPSPPPAPFDKKTARAALDDATNAVKTCRAVGDPRGTIPTTVTFGPSGEVSNVAINSSRYAGTKTARCIAERLSQARVPEFNGSPQALKRLITVH